MESTERQFIVDRTGTAVLIREVEPGSCAYTVSRQEAWDFANRLARPAKRSQDPKRRLPASIAFIALDGTSKVVKTAEAVQTEITAEAREAPQPPSGEAGPIDESVTVRPEPVAWIDQGRNREAIEDLTRQTEAGRANEFVESVLGYYHRNGRLTDGQRDAVLRGIDKRAETRSTPIPDVPAGRYAVENDEGHLAFYVIDRPTEGRWAGHTFVKVQASDELHKLPIPAAKGVLAKIAKDPKAASIRYGRELGQCGVCGRTLTDEASRAAGIGPICAQSF